MKNSDRKIEQAIRQGKIRRFMIAASMLLSIVAITFVTMGLVKPAVSLADDGGVEYPYTKVEDDWYPFVPDVTNVTVEQPTDEDGNTIGDTDGDGSIYVKFQMSFSLYDEMLEKSNYIYYDLNNDVEGDAIISVKEGGYPDADTLGDVTYDGEIVGTYRVESNGLIVIRFTDEFSDEVRKCSEEEKKTAYLSFSADVSKSSDDDSNDIKIDFTAKDDSTGEITISGYKYGPMSLEKTGSLNEDGSISWTLTVNNPNGSNLEGMSVGDTMFENASNITCSTGDGKWSYDESEGKITFDSEVTDTEITITYITYPSSKDLLSGATYNNTATLHDPDENVVKTEKESTRMDSQIGISKDGDIKYGTATGVDEDEITWTITIDNPTGADLSDYNIKDDVFKGLNADSIKINAVDGENKTEITGFELVIPEDNWEQPYLKFPEGTKAEKVTITYVTSPNSSTADDSEYKNTVTIATENNETWKSVSANVKRNQFTLSKSGYGENGSLLIRWTIKLTDNLNDDGVGLDGFIINDKGLLKAIKDGMSVNFGENVTYEVQADDTIKLTVDESKISEDWEGKKEITITYYTEADDEKLATDNGDGTYTTVNDVNASKGNISLDASTTVVYTVQKSAKKDLGTVKVSEDNTELTVPWRVYVYGDKNVFEAGFVIKDTMTSGIQDGEDLDFEIKADTFKVEIVPISGSAGQIVNGTDYKVTISEDGKGFEIELLNSGVDYSSIKEIRVSYDSVIDLDGTTSGDVVEYKNTVSNEDDSSFDATKEGTYTVVRDIKLEKQSVYSSPINEDDLEKARLEIDGKMVDCYIFRWTLSLNENGDYSNREISITDTLPKGFRLLETAEDFYYINKNSWKITCEELKNDYSWIGNYTKTLENDVQTVSFTVYNSYWVDSGKIVINYAAYIPVEEFYNKIVENGGSLTIENNAVDTNDSTTSSSTSTTVEKGVDKVFLPEDTISKASLNQSVGGYIKYVIDFNPAELDLAVGQDYITLNDILNFGDYYTAVGTDGKKGDVVNSSPADLINMSLNSIKFEKVDSEGNVTELTPAPAYTFESNPEEVTTRKVTLEGATQQYYPSDQYDLFVITGVKKGDEINLKVSGGTPNSTIPWMTIAYEDLWNNVEEIKLYNLSVDENGELGYSFSANANSNDFNGKVYVALRKNTTESVVTSASAEITHREKIADAQIKMNVPDSTHIRITYEYKASSDTVYSMPVTNTITAETSYGDAYDYNEAEFQAHDTSEARVLLELIIEKTDANNSGTKLKAGFILSKYDKASGKWQYAEGLTKDKTEYSVVTDWVEEKPEESLFYTSITASAFQIKLDEDTLYYLEEVEVPDGYDSTFKDNKYFVYDTNLSTFVSNLGSTFKDADGESVSSTKIISLLSGNTLNIKNRKKISVEIEKIWSDGNDGHSGTEVEFALYRSLVSSNSDELPSDAELQGTIKLDGTDGKWSYTWENLDSIDAYGRTYYYYVQERTTIDGYTPIYDNNGMSGENGKITVINSKGIYVNKVWLDRNGNALNNTPTEEISITLYSSTVLSAGLPDEADLKEVGKYTLSESNNWILQIEALAIKDNDNNTLYYYIVENAVDGFVSSVSGNGSGAYGNITVTNTLDKLEGVELPSTGGNGSLYAVIAGLAVIVFAGAVLGVKIRAKKI